jgi:aminomethyltransferase
VLSNDLDRITEGHSQYTLLLNERGCPIDDLIAYRLADDHVLLVVNASRLEADRDWLESRLPHGVTIDDRTRSTAMIALQGPLALSLVALPVLDQFAVGTGVVEEADALVARTGYTGEVGVELIVDAADAVRVWDGLLLAGAEPIGLGARDTLRLEMCYPLYGNDLDEEHTALEARLGWACALDTKDFVGAAALREQREAGGYDRLVPFVIAGRGIPRPGMAVIGGGNVTSGTMSPSLERGIGMAYVSSERSEPGTELEIDVRGREVAATVARKPLYTKEI